MLRDWDDLAVGDLVLARDGGVWELLGRKQGWSQVRDESGVVRAFRVSGGVEVFGPSAEADAVRVVAGVLPVADVWDVHPLGGFERNRALLGVARHARNG